MTQRQPGHPTVRSLPFDNWPTADREAWQIACRPNARLKRGGAASHMRLVTQSDFARRYGYFLDFLSRHGLLDPSGAAAALVLPHHVDMYVAELKKRVSSVTVYGSICKLRRMTQLIAPHLDIHWLIEIERDLCSDRRPRSKLNRIVLIEVLVEAGLTLIAEAESAPGLTLLRRARMVRNGVMILILACCQIRLKNFAALELGRSFVKTDGVWWVILGAEETKEKRPDERPTWDYLASSIDLYVETYRPILGKSGADSKALWLTCEGRPMRYCTVGETITETTRSIVGMPISPHLFRTAGASTAAVYGGDNPHLASAILHHKNARITEQNYSRAKSMNAAKSYSTIIDTYRNT